MKNFKRWIAALMVLAMCSILPIGIGVSANDATPGNSELALDIMFVIDGSGSMGFSDPAGIAKQACKLFVDMCDDKQARAGYVLFNTKIESAQPLMTMSSDTLRGMLHQALDKIEYPKFAGTDLSLGLTTAMNLLVEGGGIAGGRSPMIIFLSDGKTQDMSPDRVNVYATEFEDTQKFLEENDIPVYTIALNQNGEADIETLTALAERTGGKFFETNSAAELPEIISQILATQLRTNVVPIAEFVGNGKPQTVIIPIPNDSIYEANIIVHTAKGITNVHLVDPNGNEVVIPSNNITRSSNPPYDVTQITNPRKGDWQFTFTGASGDQIKVELLDSYDMTFELRADRTEITNGESITFDAYCSSLSAGEAGATIFDGAEAVIKIVNKTTGSEKQVDLVLNGDVMSASVQFSEAGDYEISGNIIGKDQSYDRPINPINIKVNPYPLQNISQKSGTSKLLFSPFLFIIRVMNSFEIPLSDVFSWDPGQELNVTPVPGGWDKKIDFQYDETTNTVKVRANRFGRAELNLNVSSAGQDLNYTIRVTIIPSWLPILLFILGAAFIAVLIIIIIRISRPRINGKFKMSVVLPPQLSSMTPPEFETDLSVLGRKGKVPLDAILATNLTTSGQYSQALAAISGFIHKITFESTKSGVLKIHLPAVDKSASVQYFAVPITKACTKTLSPNMPATLIYSTMGSEYQLTFTYGSNDWDSDLMSGNNTFNLGGNDNGFGNFGGNDNGFGNFGGNDNGFGNFGGNDNGFGNFGANDNNSFGGFGGGNDNNSFGGFGGGNSNDNSFGGFGGGNSNDNSFGGFGGGSSNNNSGFGSF